MNQNEIRNLNEAELHVVAGGTSVEAAMARVVGLAFGSLFAFMLVLNAIAY